MLFIATANREIARSIIDRQNIDSNSCAASLSQFVVLLAEFRVTRFGIVLVSFYTKCTE